MPGNWHRSCGSDCQGLTQPSNLLLEQLMCAAGNDGLCGAVPRGVPAITSYNASITAFSRPCPGCDPACSPHGAPLALENKFACMLAHTLVRSAHQHRKACVCLAFLLRQPLHRLGAAGLGGQWRVSLWRHHGQHMS